MRAIYSLCRIKASLFSYDMKLLTKKQQIQIVQNSWIIAGSDLDVAEGTGS